jgi:hypothetical protein
MLSTTTADMRLFFGNLPGGFNAIHVGHGDVQNGHIGMESRGQVHRFPAVASLA